MNQRKAKKIRQEARRIYRGSMEELAKVHSQFLKPKPKWVPMWLWIAGLKIFVKING